VRRRDEQVASRRESRDGNGVPRGRPVYGREHEISQVCRAGRPAKACRDVREHQRHGGIHRGGAGEIGSRERESEQRQCCCSQGKKEQVAQPSTSGLFHRRRAQKANGTEGLHRVRALPQQVQDQRNSDRKGAEQKRR